MIWKLPKLPALACWFRASRLLRCRSLWLPLRNDASALLGAKRTFPDRHPGRLEASWMGLAMSRHAPSACIHPTNEHRSRAETRPGAL